MSATEQKQANRLIHETSPYLLQHAYNPVDWYPWGEEAFEKARNEDKPLIVSVGYSACHWCHVMEHESFEDKEVAELMNKYFVSIKVDREERPDVDQLYIDAVSLMTGQAGWPLNVFTLPDGRPIFGGTYFPKPNWKEILQEINRVYRDEHEKVLDYAKKLEQGIQQINIIEPSQEVKPVEQDAIEEAFKKMQSAFDETYGGRASAPKFPLPDNQLFLLRYYARTQKQEALDHVDLTLTKMAQGGIYDQLGGGFARYSTDREWKVPHFEKMLYDNGQLLSLFSEGYQVLKKEEFKEVVDETIQFLEREMLSPEGGFYSALDADSEGEEGKFYTWTCDEIESLLLDKKDQDLIKQHFGIDQEGLWENGKNILLIAKTKEQLAEAVGKDLNMVKEQLKKAKNQLFEERSKRVRPGLDDKILTSWNALVLKGLSDAYRVFQDEHYLELAKTNLDFIEDKMIENSTVYRSYKDGERKIEGFLDDYALLIQGVIHYYEITFDEEKLNYAKELTDKVIKSFYDKNAGLFRYKDKDQPTFISNKYEVSDNVIASPNSVMARNLFCLSHFFESEDYCEKAISMLQAIQSQWLKQPNFFSNWGTLATHLIGNFYEVAFAGPEALSKSQEFQVSYLPHKIIAGDSRGGSKLPVLQNRFNEQETYIYVCQNKTCQQPTTDVREALGQLSI